jgi:flagellar assembly protein FliH
MSRVLKGGRLDLAVSSAQAERERAQEQLLQEAFAAGHAQGVAEGRVAAEAEGALLGAQAVAALEHLAAGSAGSSAHAAQEQRDELLRSALAVAEWVLRAELSDNGHALLQRLETAMASLLPDRETTVLVSPQDAPLVQEWARGVRVEVVVDSSLAPGDAQVRTGHGSADVSIGAAMELAAEVLGVAA